MTVVNVDKSSPSSELELDECTAWVLGFHAFYEQLEHTINLL
jgi:hypothetical protein